MNTQIKVGATTGKVISIGLLYVTAALITLMGLAFFIYSMLNNVQITVMQSNIPGAVFGAMIAFLGVRYFLSVNKLQSKVFKPNARFSWKHFRRS